MMSLEIDATYEDGVLKPDQPLPLAEHQRVKVTVRSSRKLRDGFGIIGWQGDPEVVRKIATDPEFGVHESP
jgi:predicted DNA-binding antitoxin AbrB/MazE fold protein